MDKLIQPVVYEVPMVRDGEPHGTITLIAVGSGILAACLLLFLITSMVYKKEQEESHNSSRLPEKSPPIDESPHYFANLDFTLDDELPTTTVTEKKKTSQPFFLSAITV